MDILLLVIFFFIITITIYFAISGSIPEKDSPSLNATPASTDKPQDEPANLIEIAKEIEPLMDEMAHPSDILENADFKIAVEELCGEGYTLEQATMYALGANWVLACVGFEALSRRDDSSSVVDKSVRAVPNTYAWPLFFLIRFVKAKQSDFFASRILCSAQYWWPNNSATLDQLTEFFEKAISDGEEITFGEQYAKLKSEGKKNVREFINALPDPLQATLKAKLKQHELESIDWSFLRSIGTIFEKSILTDPFFETDQSTILIEEFLGDLETMPGRSTLLVGESGVGKSTLFREFAGKLVDNGWTVLQTSAAALIADKQYVGQIEGQVRRLVRNASARKKVAVYIDDISQLRQLGRYKGKDSSILDQLWPSIESHKFLLIAETTASGLQALIQDHPSLPTAVKVVKINPIQESEAANIALQFIAHIDPSISEQNAETVVLESLQLSQQYLSYKSLPGSILSLLKIAMLRSQQDLDSKGINRDHILGALSQISGLPREILDEKQSLNVELVSQSFRKSIVGQDEAINCLVERIAMLKAGLTDPGRPIGVFLFAGPTGTGKTEIAKALAETLFGSAEQMLRLDMSEYQDPDSIWRIIGQDERSSGGSLVNRIRKNPFSVVLLDEFEKAHSKIWDVFLQVFDDGRLTDTSGRLADFRHAIIILTSNLGATITNEAGVGFTSTSGGFSPNDVLRTVNRTFRREFVNRLDRVVVFQPLSREVMRKILFNELDKALARRGLRSKQWAVEWEDSAIEFLLTEGFTPDLGARPLRRAIERHLLAPLSITMVQNAFPAGEQFLFVRSNGQELQVEFIDPDADGDQGQTDVLNTESSPTNCNLASLVLASKHPSNAAEFLDAEMKSVAGKVGSEEWTTEKYRCIEELNSNGFWDREDRHSTLERIELIDRLDSAVSVLDRLMERLKQHPDNSKLICSIANRLFVLREGLCDFEEKRPTQAYLGIRIVNSDCALEGAQEFLYLLTEMYRNWAKERGMRLQEIESNNSRYDSLFTVFGFGCFGILNPESGLHVFEIPAGESRFDRIRARVEVAAAASIAAESKRYSAESMTEILDRFAEKVEVVRRYRQLPSPLARDSVRGWRTGKLQTVLNGNFDLLSGLD